MENALSFTTGTGQPPEIPLSRYLPAVPSGMISRLSAKLDLGGKWLLDPWGSSPLLALEAAAAGSRVLVSCSNPILQSILQLMADAPMQSEFISALAVLAGSRLGNERMETQIKNIYLTECQSCREQGWVQAFLWKKGEKVPYAQFIDCGHCKAQAEVPLTVSQAEVIGFPSNPALDHARAIERIHPENHVQRESVEEFLHLYQARPLAILFSLINRIEGLEIKNEQKRLLYGLIINLCDDAASTWTWPNARTRPRSLAISPQFKENNLWFSLEKAISNWCTWQQKIPLTTWPQIPPPSGGICMFPGKIRQLPRLPTDIHIDQILAIVPYPNQAFWVSSAIWSGWLWGKDSADAMRPSLERKRVDSHWMYFALKSTFNALGSFKIPMFLIIPEATSSLCQAAVLAACETSFSLDGLSLEPDTPMAQVQFSASAQKFNGAFRDKEIAKSSIREYMETINEPATYLQISAVGLAGMASKPISPQPPTVDPFNNLQIMQKTIFDDRTFIQPFGSPAADLQSPWTLTQKRESLVSLSDQIEFELVNLLQSKRRLDLNSCLDTLFDKFQGMKTPNLNYLEECIKSYTEPDPEHAGWILLRAEDYSKPRIDEIAGCRKQLNHLGSTFGMECDGENPLIWSSQGNVPQYQFSLIASTNITRFVMGVKTENLCKRILVLPTDRMKLLAYKFKKDPALASASTGWIFLSFQLIAKICEKQGIFLDEFNQLLVSEQVGMEKSAQLSFLWSSEQD